MAFYGIKYRKKPLTGITQNRSMSRIKLK